VRGLTSELFESTLSWESELLQQGFKFIAGIDEVGMGCLAGPVVAAAVILDLEKIPVGITDSKKLTPLKRTKLDQEIKSSAKAYSMGWASVEEIDQINIYQAARLAMKRAVHNLSLSPDFLLIDGRASLELNIKQKTLIKGDLLSQSIGAASIIAKVYRDDLMKKMDEVYPGYEFAKHKGYGSVLHRSRLQERGRSPLHRKSFSWAPV